MTSLFDLPTPSLILDRAKTERNVAGMATRAQKLGVPLRPHGKTPKNVEIGRLFMQHGAIGLTTSTLREAEGYFAGGVTNLFYAVALSARKVGRVAALIKAGAEFLGLVDHVEAARQIAEAATEHGVELPLLIEVDVDGYRAGVPLDDPGFLRLAVLLRDEPGVRLAGLMSYGGASYGLDPAGAADLAERHRLALLRGRAVLADAGMDCPMLSFGSSPAVLHATRMDGITELRCGIFAFQDLFQAAIGACRVGDIALSVLTEVIGVRPDLNRAIVDAGGLAMSKDLSTARTRRDAGYGLVCDIDGEVITDVYMSATSQELGLLTTFSGGPLPFDRLTIGTRVRILPNHADMTAAAYDGYHVIGGPNDDIEYWPRFNGW